MPAPISKNAMRAMIAIIVVLLLVAIYANVQTRRRSTIESAKFIAPPTASPAATTP
jgi:hypothetical protein